MKRLHHILPIIALLPLLAAAEGPTTIDHSKAMNGTLPGDAAGYPVTITQPGHYVLIGNLNVPVGVGGIVIGSAGVTLDLNGFSVRSGVLCEQSLPATAVNCNVSSSTPGSNASKAGIYVESDALGAVIRNGAVRGFRSDGIFVHGQGVLIERVVASHNRRHGMFLGGPLMHPRVIESAAMYNGETGIDGGAAYIYRTDSSHNGGNGFQMWAGGIVSDSQATWNDGYGVAGSSTAGMPKGAVRGSVMYGNKTASLSPSAYSLGGNYGGFNAY